MEPSHVAKHSNAVIDRAVDKILRESFLRGIDPPIDIDLVAEKQSLIDCVGFIPSINSKFDVDAVLLSKLNGKFDILIDTYICRVRANFSVAHEIGHVVLHPKLYSGCSTIDDSIALSKRIKKSYKKIEREANYFAGAILIPRQTIFDDTQKIYKGILGGYAGDLEWENIIPMLCAALANRYQVSVKTMQIRLNQLRIDSRLLYAITNRLNFISWD
jgi:Zn-dependent peptidase ImmA (M78 family)